MTFLKLFLFVLSSLGSFELLRLALKDGVNTYWLPSLTIAVQVTVLFFAGLLNLLPEAVWGLYLLGFGGLLCQCISYKKSSRRGTQLFLAEYLKPGYVVLLVVLGAATLYVRGKVFTHYDNFSHWALVVQQMLMKDRFPNFRDTLIIFQEYPLGSASYIYFFAKLVGTEEPIQMLAQIYMISAALLPLFTFVTKNKIFSSVGMLSFFYFAFVYNTFITELLVDTLLPVVGSCGLLFAVLYCKKGCGKATLWCSAFYMVQVIQIKNSGIFFALLILFVILYRAEKGRNLFRCAPSLLFPFLSLLLWQKHCKYVFPDAAASRHAMTAENYLSTFSSKSTADLLKICSSFLKFAISWKDIWIAALFFAVLGCMIYVLGKNLWKCYRNIFLGSVLLYILYQLGMLAMYLFSMPTAEALGLASSVRYSKTILIAIAYWNMIPALMLASEVSSSKAAALLASACIPVSVCAFLFAASGSLKPEAEFSPEKRLWMDAAVYEYAVPKYDTYCILCDQDSRDYYFYLAQYLLHSDAILSVSADDPNSKPILNQYILVQDPEKEPVLDWVRTNFPDQVGRHVILQ